MSSRYFRGKIILGVKNRILRQRCTIFIEICINMVINFFRHGQKFSKNFYENAKFLFCLTQLWTHIHPDFYHYLTHPLWGCVCLFCFWVFPHPFYRFFLINFRHIKASNLIFACEFFSDQEQHNGGSFVGCSIKEYRKKTKKRISDFWWVSFFLPAKFLKNRTNIFFTFRTNSSRNAS